MKGEIAGLEKVFDSSTCTWYWVATINFEVEPSLKLGSCEVKQVD